MKNAHHKQIIFLRSYPNLSKNASNLTLKYNPDLDNQSAFSNTLFD